MTAKYLFDPATVAPDWSIMRVAAGCDGDLLILSREHPWPRGGAWAPEPVRYRIDQWRQEQVRRALLPESLNLLQDVQPMPGEKWLVVACRARSEHDPNAQVYDQEGRPTLSFYAGDGIEDVQATRDGQIWISYFDEGVFGRQPLGHAGLACFDCQGMAQFRYNHARQEHGLPPIDSCYALNVATAADTWLYYYSSFPLVHLTDLRLNRYWTDLPVRGSKAFAVCGDRALFSGGYRQNDQFFLLSLITGTIDEVQVIDERGNRVAPSMTYRTGVSHAGRPYDWSSMAHHACFGRGERLYIRADQGLYVVDLSQLP